MTRKDSTVKKSGSTRWLAQQQLERAIGHLEVIALVFQVLQLVEDPPDHLAIEFEAEFCRLHGQGRAACHLGDDHSRAVPDRVRWDVLVEVELRATALACRPPLSAKTEWPT